MQHGCGGEGVAVSRKTRLTDDEVRQVRSRQMYVMRLQGRSVAEIGTFFSFDRGWIYKELRAIPEAEKRRIEGRFARGQVA